MSQQNNEKRALIPQLRFPEFQDTGEWAALELLEISVPVEERVGDRRLTCVSISAGIGFVPQSEKFGRDISGNQYRLYTVVRDGDFVYNKGNSLKFPQGCVYDLQGWGEVAAPNVFICFRLKAGYENGFFRHCFENNTHGLQLKKHITSGARSNGLLNIGREAFFGVKIPVPRHAEQQRIADCLFSLGELITTEIQVLHALKTHKKGLMQHLFPRDREIVPRLRFPEFQEMDAWERRSIDTLVQDGVLEAPRDGNHGNSHPKASDYVSKGIPFVMASDIKDGEINYEQCTFIKKTQADFLQKGFAIEGDVLLTHKGTVGAVAVVGKIDYPYIMLTPQVTYYRVRDKTKLLNKFLAHAFTSGAFQTLISVAAGGGTRSYIGITEQAKLAISMPVDIAEQQKIADGLTSLDNLIAARAQKIKLLHWHKKALMQRLFPVLDEVPA